MRTVTANPTRVDLIMLLTQLHAEQQAIRAVNSALKKHQPGMRGVMAY